MFGILDGVLFYVKMYLASLLVKYFGNVDPSLYIIGQEPGNHKHQGYKGDRAPDIVMLVSLLRANQLLLN